MDATRFKFFLKSYGILIISICFILVIKIPHLRLSYSWDEAWSYLPAFMEMLEKGLNPVSGSIDIFSSKGHPLLFYFLSTSWLRFFSGGTENIVLVRCFQLLVAMVVTVVLFMLAKKLVSLKVANYTVAILSVQTIYLAQASLILPEMMLTLFLLFSVYSYMTNKMALYVLSASLMVLTKETGLLFAGGFGLFFLFENRKVLFHANTIKKTVLFTLPLVVFGLHLLFNYNAYGTFFFTEHLDYITIAPENMKRVLKSATGILFTMHGRNMIFVATILSILILLFRKERFEHGRLLLLLIFQIILLTAFTSVNFYTYRYMLPALPLFILLSVILVFQAFQKKKYLLIVLLILMTGSPLYYSLTKRGNLDVDLGYSVYIPLHKEIVVYCEKQNWFDKTFAANFNMVLALRDPFTMFHETNSGFNTQHLPKLEGADIVVLESTGDIKQLPENEAENFNLHKRFENKNHWGEIYLRKAD